MCLKTPDVYAVVLNFNGLECNSRCIHSLLAQDYPTLSILFVDNGSTDNSLHAVQEEFGDALNYLMNHENLYFAAGNNRGIRYALDSGAEYIFIVNNDTKLDSCCVSELVRFLEKHPGAGGCQPVIHHMDESGEVSNEIASAGVHISLSGRCWDERNDEAMNVLPKVPRIVNGITGGAMMLPVRVIRDVGMFNEDYVMYFEDVDLSFRILEAGYLLYAVPSAEMGHAVGTTTPKHAPLLLINRCEANSYRLIVDHFPGSLALFGIMASFCFSVGSLGKALMQRNFPKGRAVWSGMVEGLSYFLSHGFKALRSPNGLVVRRHVSTSVLFPLNRQRRGS